MMVRGRLLVSMVAGAVRTVLISGRPERVPWAPGVLARAVDRGVLLEGGQCASHDVPELAIGGWGPVGGKPTSCLAAQRDRGGRIDAFLGPDLVGTGPDFVGTGPAMLAVMHRVVLAAHAQEPMLLLGETGTGKDLLARALHDLRPQRAGPFFALNVAALPAELVESELFGCVRGAFTGADRGRPGAFEAADGGTIFLDEVAEASAATQAKLLRVVESGLVRRIGASSEVKVRVRTVAATHRNPIEAVAQGMLRTDLMERLGCMVIRVPPLRDRPEDLPALVTRLGGGLVLDSAMLDILAAYGWPGNVRELRNVLGRARWLGGGAEPGAENLREAIAMGWRGPVDIAPRARGSRRRQIDASGLPRSTFYYRLKRYGDPGIARGDPACVNASAS